PEQARQLIDRGMRIAAASRTVTAVIVPVDVQHAEHEEPERRHGAVFSSAASTRQRPAPDETDVRRAAEVLNAGERVAILIGQGASGAAEEVTEVAEVMGAGIAKALNGRAALPDDLP